MEFVELKARREALQEQVNALLTQLQNSDYRFEFLKALFEPHINIIEVNNESMGHRYIGRFSVPYMNGKPQRFTVSISPIEGFESKNDPKLKELARKKALELLKRKHPELFFEKT